jgi:predicted NBD/HSP70 family sugar kinase
MKRVYLHKAKNQIARPNTIRDINRQIVLNYVRERAPISRAEIARETELQRSTVSEIVDGLQASGLIEEIGAGHSTGGRKPTLLKLKTGVPVAIGVDVTPRQTTVALADLAGKVLEKETFPTSPDADFMSEQIIARVSDFACKYKDTELEVGISVPGITDQPDCRTLYIPYFQWHDWNIGKQIAEKTNLRVVLENDANAVALAELWFGRRKIQNIRNFVTVLVGEGIGTGIVFDGQLYRGENGAAGELGHMIVGNNAPVQCSCGGRDCWEAHASEKALIARYNKLSNNSEKSVSAAQIIEHAVAGENDALEALKETTRYLGIGISNLIVGLSPQAVIISGSITKAWHLIESDLYSLADRSVRQDIPKTTLMISSLSQTPTLIGALALVLARKFALTN